MKKMFLFIVLGLVFIVGCLFVENTVSATATFSYTGSGGTITVTNNDTIQNISTVENSTLFTLQTRAGRTSSDANYVAFTYKLRVNDRKGVYGNQFYCDVYAYSGFTSCVISFPVTWFNGSTGWVNLTFTGTGKQNIPPTGFVITRCESSKLTKTGTGSISYRMNQSFYGIMSNFSGNIFDYYDSGDTWWYNTSLNTQYNLMTSGFTVGFSSGSLVTNLVVKDKQIMFYQNPYFSKGANQGFGLRSNSSIFIQNSSIIVSVDPDVTSGTDLLRSTSSVGTKRRIFINDSFLDCSRDPGAGSISLDVNTNCSIKNSILNRMCFALGTLNLENVVIKNPPSYTFYNNVIAYSNNVIIDGGTDGFAMYEKNFNLTNFVFKTTRLGSIFSTTKEVHIIDSVTDSYTLLGVVGGFQAGSYLGWDKTVNMCLMSNGSVVEDVNLSFYNKTGVLMATVLSGVDGCIPEQILPDRHWDSTTTTSHYDMDSPYRVRVWKNGYQEMNLTMNLTEPISETIEILEVPTLTQYENLVNVTGTNDYSWDGSGFKIWENYSSPLAWFMNIVNAVVTHENQWNGTHQKIWINGTGNASSGGSDLLSVINPNPGKGTTSYDTNFINQQASLASSVEVIYRNFTTPPATLPGDYILNTSASSFGNGQTVQNNSGVYADVWENSSGQVASGGLGVGQYELAGDYMTMRGYLKFDTSSLPDEAVITSAHVSFVIQADIRDTEFNVTLQQVKPPAPHTPLIPGDYNKANFPPSATFGNRNIGGFSTDDRFNISVNASGIADISLSGDTCWVLRSDQDVIADAPGVGADEWVIFDGAGGVNPGRSPHLIVNYTVPSSNWAYFVNLTASSNSSGAWVDYGVLHANSNGTWTFPPNGNWSGADTKYYWNVSYTTPSEGTLETGVFNFTTGLVNMFFDANVSVINPNPGNASTVNLLEGNPFGLDTGVVVRCRNFTTPPATPPTTTSFVSTTDDGFMYGRDSNYATAQSQGTATFISSGLPVSSVGQDYKPPGINLYTVYRGFFMFNTSSLPDDVIIESAVLHLHLRLDATTTSDFNVTVQNGQPVYPHIPAVNTDYDKTYYSGDGGKVNTASFGAVNSPVDIVLNSTGVSWVNKTGMTKFLLRSDRDISATTPVGAEYVSFNTSDDTTGHPYLTIYYHSSWGGILNITYSSNSSGSWEPYGLVYAVENTTYTVHNSNFSDNDTRYYWRTVAVCNGSVVLDNQTWWFETGDLQVLIDVTSIVPIGGGSGVLMMVPLSCVALMGGLLGVRKKRRKQT